MSSDRGGPGERLYAALLRCYPAAFRARFESGMREAFRSEQADTAGAGVLERARFWFWTCTDAAWFGLAARVPVRSLGEFRMKSFLAIGLRDAVRSLRATPVVTAVAVLSLALGIGANTALFSILNSLWLKTLPVADPASLAIVDGGSWTNPIWEEIRGRRQQLFADAFAWSGSRFNLSTHGATDFVDGAWASGNMFEVLGVRALLGRTFTEADDRRDGGPDGPVAVISHAFWQRRFNRTPDVLGHQLSVDGVTATVIGVMPRGFFGPDVGRSADVIVPIRAIALGPEGRMLDGRSTWWLEIMARLRPGQSVAQASAALEAMRPQIRAATLPQDWPAKEQAHYMSEPLKLVSAATGESDLRSSYLTPLQIVLVVVAAVLVIAAANLANLLLARASARRHELAVRLALGASRFRLAKQLLAESGILAAAGAVLGLGVAKFGSALLVRQIASTTPGFVLDLSIDWRVLAFTAAVAAAAALIFGVAPALGMSGIAPQHALKEQSRSVTGDRRFGLRQALVVVQVALSLALVVGAALFVRTLARLSAAPLGFDPAPLLSVTVNANAVGEDRAARLATFEHLRETAAGVPGVASASTSALTPVSSMRWNTRIEATPATTGLTDRQRISWVNMIEPGWFATFGMHVLEGRDFTPHDGQGAERVLIVNQSFAKRFFPAGSAVGQIIRAGLDGPDINTLRIVGVVNDAIYTSPRAGFTPTIYAPLGQLEQMVSTAVVVVRAVRGDPELLDHDLTTALAAADPRVSFTIRRLSNGLVASTRQERLVALLGGFFGALALLLAAIGLYGVASHSVSQRRAEIGIRMALGADARGVVHMVLARLGWLLAAGVLVGIALSWWAVQLVEKLIFGLRPRDPFTFVSAAVVLGMVGLLAGWLPARRASRIDPVRVLREA